MRRKEFIVRRGRSEADLEEILHQADRDGFEFVGATEGGGETTLFFERQPRRNGELDD